MQRNTPRGFQLIRAAIADIEDLGELAKLRDLAREQWGDDPQHAELEALLDRRAAEVSGEAGTQIPLPFATIPAADPVKGAHTIAKPQLDELGAPFQDLTLAAGDCLYIPRGYPPSAETTKTSLMLSRSRSS